VQWHLPNLCLHLHQFVKSRSQVMKFLAGGTTNLFVKMRAFTESGTIANLVLKLKQAGMNASFLQKS